MSLNSRGILGNGALCFAGAEVTYESQQDNCESEVCSRKFEAGVGDYQFWVALLDAATKQRLAKTQKAQCLQQWSVECVD